VHTALVLVQYLSVPGTVSATTAPRSPALSLPGALLASPGPRSQSCTGSLAKSTHAPSRRVPRTESVCLALRGILHPPTPFLHSWAGTCSCVVARVLVCARASLPSEIGIGGTLFFFSSSIASLCCGILTRLRPLLNASAGRRRARVGGVGARGLRSPCGTCSPWLA
jgi:hypothetical protein